MLSILTTANNAMRYEVTYTGDPVPPNDETTNQTTLEVLQDIRNHEEYQSTLMTVSIGITVVAVLFYIIVWRPFVSNMI